MYVVAQLVGAVVGAWLLTLVIPVAAQGNLGAHGLGAGITASGGLLAEIVLTFVLVFVVFATAIDPKGLAHLAPLAIGFTLTSKPKQLIQYCCRNIGLRPIL